MQRRDFILSIGSAALLSALAGCGTTGSGSAAPASRNRYRAIDTDFFAVLERLSLAAPGFGQLVGGAQGVLCFPTLRSTGTESQYGGEGALRVGDAMESYHRITTIMSGMAHAADPKSITFLFKTASALDGLRANRNWTVGVDSKVGVVALASNRAIDTASTKEAVLALILDARGALVKPVLRETRIVPLDV